MAIGVYNGHGFLIKNVDCLGVTFVCNDCGSRLTKSNNLQRHAKVCTRGEKKVRCPEQKLEAPLNSYSRWFYTPRSDKRPYSKNSIAWLEQEMKERGVHIHHGLCEHRGESRIAKDFVVDVFALAINTVFELVTGLSDVFSGAER